MTTSFTNRVGLYLPDMLLIAPWDSNANWSNGVPGNGDDVVIAVGDSQTPYYQPPPYALDNIPNLTLNSIEETAGNGFNISVDLGVQSWDNQAPGDPGIVIGGLGGGVATVSVGSLTGVPLDFIVSSGSTLAVGQDAAGGELYYLEGGTVSFETVPVAGSTVHFDGGKLVLGPVGGSVSAALTQVAPGDVIEVPYGVASVTIGVSSITITGQNGQTLDLANVGYIAAVSSASITKDRVTGGSVLTLTAIPSTNTVNTDLTIPLGAAQSYPGGLNLQGGGAYTGNGTTLSVLGTLDVDGPLAVTTLGGNEAVLDVSGAATVAGDVLFEARGGISVETGGRLVIVGDVLNASTNDAITATGSNTSLTVDGAFAGSLYVTSGASATLGSLLENGTVSVGAAGLVIEGAASIGDGALTISNGATVSVGGALDIGGHESFDVAITVDHSELTVARSLDFSTVQLGSFGSSELDVSNGGVVTVGGNVIFVPGSVVDVTQSGGGELVVGNPAPAGVVGMVEVARGFGLLNEAPANVVEDGKIIGGVADMGLVDAGGGLFTITGPLTGAGSLQVESDGTLELGGSVAATLQVTFNGGGGTLLLDDPAAFAASVQGFSAGDTFDFAPGAATGASYDGSMLSVTLESGAVEQIAVSSTGVVGPPSAGMLQPDGSLTLTAACYCRGTHILTDCGEVAVEALLAGDRVITHSGATESVRWMGRRSYTRRVLAGNTALLPITIHAGALGDGLPHKNLRVSPRHAMLLDGLLIPAGELVNGLSIVRERGCTKVDYFHIELDHHDAILAEGAASETFLDDGSRGLFDNAADHPAGFQPAGFCAPVIESGWRLEAIRSRLAWVAGLQKAA